MKKLIAFFLFILAAAYVGYQIHLGSGTSLNTEPALTTVYSETIETQALFLRDETVVEFSGGGALRYSVEDGHKLSKGGVVAQVYASEEDIQISEELLRLDEEIAQFERLSGQTELSGTKPDVVKKRVENQLVSLLEQVRKNELSDFESARSKLLEALCQQQVATGASDGFAEKTAQLKESRTALEQQYRQPVSVVYAPCSGYFASVPDGYETAVDFDSVLELTPEQIRAISPSPVSPQAVGKISNSHEWYAVTVLSAEDAKQVKKGSQLYLIIPSTSQRIPVTVEEVNQQSIESEAAVIFKGTVQDETTAALRNETVQIEVQRYSGLKINRDAVHIERLTREVKDEEGNVTTEEKEVQGVYIIYGEQIKFREIAPLYWGGNFVICDTGASPTFSVPMVSLYDQVVIGGKDLYDGKDIR